MRSQINQPYTFPCHRPVAVLLNMCGSPNGEPVRWPRRSTSTLMASLTGGIMIWLWQFGKVTYRTLERRNPDHSRAQPFTESPVRSNCAVAVAILTICFLGSAAKRYPIAISTAHRTFRRTSGGCSAQHVGSVEHDESILRKPSAYSGECDEANDQNRALRLPSRSRVGEPGALGQSRT